MSFINQIVYDCFSKSIMDGASGKFLFVFLIALLIVELYAVTVYNKGCKDKKMHMPVVACIFVIPVVVIVSLTYCYVTNLHTSSALLEATVQADADVAHFDRGSMCIEVPTGCSKYLHIDESCFTDLDKVTIDKKGTAVYFLKDAYDRDWVLKNLPGGKVEYRVLKLDLDSPALESLTITPEMKDKLGEIKVVYGIDVQAVYTEIKDDAVEAKYQVILDLQNKKGGLPYKPTVNIEF